MDVKYTEEDAACISHIIDVVASGKEEHIFGRFRRDLGARYRSAIKV